MSPPGEAPRPGWSQRLFGSLVGQLRLAASASLVLGFTAAVAFTLRLNQQSLWRQHQVSWSLAADILKSPLDRLARDPSPEHARQLRQELERLSSPARLFWVQRGDGSLLLPRPSSGDGAAVERLARRTLEIHAGGGSGALVSPWLVGADRTVVKGLRGVPFLTHPVLRSPDGSSLWAAEDIGDALTSLRSLLLVLALVWGLCLLLTLVAISLLTGRITQPLRDLNRKAAGVTSESLASSHLNLRHAPLEVQELARTYNGLLDRLALAWSQQRQFVGLVSHELRNPLMIIGGYLRRLQRRGQNLDPEQMRALATTEAETHRITRMLNDLLDLSRSESGQLQMVLAPVAVDEVLTTACDLARSQLSRPLLLNLPREAAEGPIKAIAETDRLQQVLLNLIENADKYSPPGRPISLDLTRDARGLCISVRDQGIGIPAEDLPKVFDRFHRSRNAVEHERGSGLGLSVVKLLVEAMGGSIEVESEMQVGSRFHIHLPAAP